MAGVRQLNVLPDPDEYRPECCGRAARFLGWKDPFGMLKYVYECAAGCGWSESQLRMWRHPVTGKPHQGLTDIIDTLPETDDRQPQLW